MPITTKLLTSASAMRWLLLLMAVGARCAFAEAITGTVVRVIDGVTVVVQDPGKKRYRVRLAEIDAPERDQPFWREATRSLAELCHKKEAKVEWSERDS